MKKIIFLFTLISVVFCEEWDIDKIPKNIKYCQIVGTKLIKKISIYVDFGQSFRSSMKGTGQIKKGGKYFSFNSMIEALNFMNDNGWEFVNAYAFSTGSQSVYHFLLKRID